jgi:sodium pump decarboxylase gamma subunit
MHVLENFKHAETFSQMSMSDKLLATGYVILLGVGITFIALLLIWWITILMSKTVQKLEAKTNLTEVKAKSAQKPAQSPPPLVVSSVDDDSELIAVISAAIAASLNTTVQSIRVSNIRRISDATPTWGKSGRNDVMNARF